MADVKNVPVHIYTGYHIQKNGNIVYLDNGKTRIQRPFKHTIKGKAYNRVKLVRDGLESTEMVHRLLAIAYIPNPSNKPFVLFRDGDTTNIKLHNLQWADKYDLRKLKSTTGE